MQEERRRKDRITTNKGYRLVYMPEHPRADRSGYVFEHIVVWERYHNKQLPDGWVIHHIDMVKTNNVPENLMALTVSEHTILHHTGSKRTPETRQKISERAKERLKDKSKHWHYKEIDVLALSREVADGATVKSVCEKYNINKTTYYKKLKEATNNG
jgi:hypothetical protein